MTALSVIMRLTLRRAMRGYVVWLALVFAALPLVYAATARGRHRVEDELLALEMVALAIIQPMLVAASIGDEVEDRTMTYLWSRPLPRWTVLVGKLVALAPIGAAVVAASTYACYQLEYGISVPALPLVAIAAGALAAGVIAAAIATLVPRYAMPLAITYLGIDVIVGQIKWSLADLSITHQTLGMFGRRDWPTPAIVVAAVATVWLVIGLVRVRRLET